MVAWTPDSEKKFVGPRESAWLESRLRSEAEMRARRRGERRSLLRLSAVLLTACLVIALLPHAFGL